jgi:hypothetical protein
LKTAGGRKAARGFKSHPRRRFDDADFVQQVDEKLSNTTLIVPSGETVM